MDRCAGGAAGCGERGGGKRAAAAGGIAALVHAQRSAPLTTPKLDSATPPARAAAIGITCLISRNTRTLISIMSSASTVTSAAPRSAVCAA